MAARIADEGPALPMMILDGDAHLILPHRFKWRQVDAPEMPGTVLGQGLQDESRADAVRDAGLHYLLRPQMLHQAVDRPYQAGIAIIPIKIAFGSGRNTMCGQGGNDRWPDRGSGCADAAGPGNAEQGM